MTRSKRSTASRPATYVAFLRAINVGGHNRLLKDELVDLFAGAGAAAPRTFLQSGNVVYRATPETAVGVPARVSAAIATRHGYTVPVLQRSAAELGAIAARRPFPPAVRGDLPVQVVLLADPPPSAAALESLRAVLSNGELLRSQGRELYLLFPEGLGSSRLDVRKIDSLLETTSTIRTWNTVARLAASCDGDAA